MKVRCIGSCANDGTLLRSNWLGFSFANKLDWGCSFKPAGDNQNPHSALLESIIQI
jgi:hypothetical protein